MADSSVRDNDAPSAIAIREIFELTAAASDRCQLISQRRDAEKTATELFDHASRLLLDGRVGGLHDGIAYAITEREITLSLERDALGVAGEIAAKRADAAQARADRWLAGNVDWPTPGAVDLDAIRDTMIRAGRASRHG